MKPEVESTANVTLPEWTVDRVKGELPEVRVKIAPKVHVMGRVLGRRLEFPKVLLPDGRQYEFAWETITRALNKKKPLCI